MQVDVSKYYIMCITYPQLILVAIVAHGSPITLFAWKNWCCQQWRRPAGPGTAAKLSAEHKREVMGNCISTFVVEGSLSQKDLIFKHFGSFLDTNTLTCYDFTTFELICWFAHLLSQFIWKKPRNWIIRNEKWNGFARIWNRIWSHWNVKRCR